MIDVAQDCSLAVVEPCVFSNGNLKIVEKLSISSVAKILPDSVPQPKPEQRDNSDLFTYFGDGKAPSRLHADAANRNQLREVLSVRTKSTELIPLQSLSNDFTDHPELCSHFTSEERLTTGGGEITPQPRQRSYSVLERSKALANPTHSHYGSDLDTSSRHRQRSNSAGQKLLRLLHLNSIERRERVEAEVRSSVKEWVVLDVSAFLTQNNGHHKAQDVLGPPASMDDNPTNRHAKIQNEYRPSSPESGVENLKTDSARVETDVGAKTDSIPNAEDAPPTNLPPSEMSRQQRALRLSLDQSINSIFSLTEEAESGEKEDTTMIKYSPYPCQTDALDPKKIRESEHFEAAELVAKPAQGRDEEPADRSSISGVGSSPKATDTSDATRAPDGVQSLMMHTTRSEFAWFECEETGRKDMRATSDAAWVLDATVNNLKHAVSSAIDKICDILEHVPPPPPGERLFTVADYKRQ